MNAFAADIRKLITDRLANASTQDMLALASAICANDEPPIYVSKASSRFTKLDLHGRSATEDWVAVYDSETNLTWTRKPLECGSVPWKDGLKAASEYRLFGKNDWRLPTVKDYVSIFDYSRVGPVLDPALFTASDTWEWTNQIDANNPSDYAWFVSLRYGGVYGGYQTSHGYVRAVRAGQPLSLGL